MRAKDHPNHTSDVPMIVPPWAESFQIRYLNPVVRRLSGAIPGVALIRHRGRRSGLVHETPVTPYRKGDLVAISLIHGKTNWVKNVLAAAEADLHLRSGDLHLVNPRIVPAGSDGTGLPLPVRMQLKRVGAIVFEVA
jgi:deazaflavin-dependent oxidoreductase (nitroreductase family)